MSNEAAERLRDLMRNALVGWDSRTLDGLRDGLDDALAAERRATVERIRERFDHIPPSATGSAISVRLDSILAILNEEAAR